MPSCSESSLILDQGTLFPAADASVLADLRMALRKGPGPTPAPALTSHAWGAAHFGWPPLAPASSVVYGVWARDPALSFRHASSFGEYPNDGGQLLTVVTR